MNNEKIEIALAKLTDEEKELLCLNKQKVKKYHKFKINYMIGDGNGNTNEERKISLDNQFLELITNALDKLRIKDGHWGIMLSEDRYEWNFEKKCISEKEYHLLSLVSDCIEEENSMHFLSEHGFDLTETNLDYLQEFEGMFISETAYSFLVYQDYNLK